MKSNGSTEDCAFIGARISPVNAGETEAVERLRRELETLKDLGPDERRLINDLSRKLSGKGKREYGQLHLATDMRNPCREAAEELTDAIAYTQMLATGWADYIDRLRAENAELRSEVERLRTPPGERFDPIGRPNHER